MRRAREGGSEGGPAQCSGLSPNPDPKYAS